VDGSYGIIGLYVNGGSGGWQQVQGYATLAATEGWQRIHGSLSGIPAQTYDSVVVGFISNGGSSLTNTVNYWIDNVRLTAPPSVHTNRPALSIAKAPPAWALTFNNNTNVTIAAPDGTSTTLAIPDSDAANFQGDYMQRFGRRAADHFCRLKLSRNRHQPIEINEHKNTRMLGERPERSRSQNRTVG
jgi:hypothetical protein